MIDRNTDGIRESDLVIPTLRFCSDRAGGEISTSELIYQLTALFQPTSKDAEIIEGRNDTYFSQKVRNMISHREGRNSYIANGYAEYTGTGIRITDAGRKLLTTVNG